MTETQIQESISGHRARNAELLKRIGAKGLALDRPYSVEHHFWASSQGAAASLARELYTRGYLVTVIAPHQADDRSRLWNVEATIQRTLSEAASDRVSEELIRLAAPFDAVYDGWGASV